MSRIFNCTGHRLMIPNIVDSDGIYLFDDQGKRYMDLESGVWCTSLGHKNPRINALIKKQIDSIMHAGYCYSNDKVEEGAASVLSVTGFEDGKCVFLCSGSESIELARQISKRLTDKKLSMTLHDSYLGSYSSVTDRTQNWFLFNWEKCAQCPDMDNCRTDCEELQKVPRDVSDFIFEPGSASGFVKFAPRSLITNLVNIVRGNGGKIIANEVTTGIGRTGKWFGHHHYPIEPDMIAIGKGIGNGYPVSITVLNRPTSDQLGELVKGIIRDETKNNLLEIVKKLTLAEGIHGLILGETELPLILKKTDAIDVPFLDTTRIHVESVLEQLL